MGIFQSCYNEIETEHIKSWDLKKTIEENRENIENIEEIENDKFLNLETYSKLELLQDNIKLSLKIQNLKKKLLEYKLCINCKKKLNEE